MLSSANTVKANIVNFAQSTRAKSQPHCNTQKVLALFDVKDELAELSPSELKKIAINSDGEFLPFGRKAQAQDVVKHIESALNARGFGCYVLHNGVWVVPFIHDAIQVPDFERAKCVLPDLKREIIGKAFPNHSCHQNKQTLKDKPSKLALLGGVVACLGAFVGLIYLIVHGS